VKRIAVYVATTGGPVQVERITRERAPQSMVCLKRTSTVLPISAAYDSFVRPGSGVIERVFGPFEEGAFRLDVSAPIETGGSWKLGFFVAHALHAAVDSELAGPGQTPDAVVWLTGHVDYDLAVGAVGHIAEKMHASREAMAGWLADGLPVTLFVHDGSDRDAVIAAGVPAGVQVVPVNSALDVLTALKIAVRDRRPVALQQIAPPRRYAGWRTAAALLIGGVTSVTLAASLMNLRTPPPADVAVADPSPLPQSAASPASTVQTAPAASVPQASAPATASVPVRRTPETTRLSIFERRAPPGRTCADVQFGAVEALKVPVTIDEMKSSTSAVRGLCGLAMVVDNADRHFVAVVVHVLSGRLLSGSERPEAFSGQHAFAGMREWAIDVPRRLDEPFDIQVVAIGGEKPVAEAAKWLKSQSNVTAAAQKLLSQGVEMSVLRHRVLP
jgi:hypothetical protein